MGQRDEFSPGTFSWAELSTPDQAAAGAFYGSVFGWEIEEIPIGGGAVYSMARLGGRYVAAISPQPQQQREAGVPSHWGSYITVVSAEETLARVEPLGGQVHAGPFDVFDSGRMGVIQDPQGAMFMVWEPREHIGAGVVNAPGALSWNDLATPDLEGASRFYAELFGWRLQPYPGGETEYLVIQRADGAANGGIRPLAPGETMPYWLVYFASADLEASLTGVQEAGGVQLAGPMPIGEARMAVAQDAVGAAFALYEGPLDD